MSPADLRKDYTRGSLRRADLDANPLKQFERWFADAQAAAPVDPNAMTLATVGANGAPSVRTLLLKGIDERGFLFFTNYRSRKARELEMNPRAAIVFYWRELERQVAAEGVVEKLTALEAEIYFHSRPRGSQIGAWASQQSTPIPNREFLEKCFADAEAKFPGDIPIPPFWGGYVLKPERIEFWQGGASRLHDRFEYLKQPDGTWKVQRLSP